MLKIDNCKYCAAITHTRHATLQSLLYEIEQGEMGCWLCMEGGNNEHHTEFDIFDRDKKVWCGHMKRCEDMLSQIDEGFYPPMFEISEEIKT